MTSSLVKESIRLTPSRYACQLLPSEKTRIITSALESMLSRRDSRSLFNSNLRLWKNSSVKSPDLSRSICFQTSFSAAP